MEKNAAHITIEAFEALCLREANFVEQLDSQVLLALQDGVTIENGRAAVTSITTAR